MNIGPAMYIDAINAMYIKKVVKIFFAALERGAADYTQESWKSKKKFPVGAVPGRP